MISNIKIDKGPIKRRAINEIRTLITRYNDEFRENRPEESEEFKLAIEEVCNHVANILNIELTKITPNKYMG